MKTTVLADRTLHTPASEIRRMFNMAQGMTDVINLSIGEPDFDTPAHIAEAAVAATRGGYHHYSVNAGFIELRRALAAKLQRDNGITVDPATELNVTIGASEALGLLMQTLINPGDEVILGQPYWPNYISHIAMAGGVPVLITTREEDGFRLLADDVRRAITPRTRAILINSPANPTGAVMGEAEIRALAEVAAQAGVYLISDEVYEKVIYDGNRHFSPGALPGAKDFVITVNSFSKAYAMCGWRVGYVAARPDLIAPLVKMQEGMASCACSVSQMAALAALEGTQAPVQAMVEQYRARRDLLVAGINAIPGLSCTNPGGAFYLFVNVKRFGRSAAEVAEELLKRAQVVLVPGTGFGPAGEGYVRIAYARDEAILREALGRIRRVAGELL